MVFIFPTCFTRSKKFITPKIFKNQFLKFSSSSVITEESLKKIKYFLIVDFEATCSTSRKKYQQEIIEFPCLKLNARTLIEESRFHRFVRPTIQPVLTDYCIQLTGILQEIVDNEKPFPEVYEAFEEWRAKEDLTDENSLYITSGDWDFGRMIPLQCEFCDLEIPSHMKVWSDIKKLFADETGVFLNTQKEIMDYYGVESKGRLHSGLDDCKNLGNLVRCLVKNKAVIYPTSKLVFINEKRKVQRLKLYQKEPLKHLFIKST